LSRTVLGFLDPGGESREAKGVESEMPKARKCPLSTGVGYGEGAMSPPSKL